MYLSNLNELRKINFEKSSLPVNIFTLCHAKIFKLQVLGVEVKKKRQKNKKNIIKTIHVCSIC